MKEDIRGGMMSKVTLYILCFTITVSLQNKVDKISKKHIDSLLNYFIV